MFYYKDIILDKINLNKLECSESARKGDPIAQYNLGSCYQHGNGVIKDYNKALLWYSKSANNGYALGQNNLGELYEKGFGCNKDYNKAFEWYSKSANYECAEGQKNLGNCYYYGRGITKDYNKAFELYLKSANNGCALGQNSLGTNINVKEAIIWYKKALDNGFENANKELNKILLKKFYQKIIDYLRMDKERIFKIILELIQNHKVTYGNMALWLYY
ncbi:unnamed protein product [Rhizophagus irregularis]|nr:unnamed protein product [Rhizophagus irregularis]